MELNFLVRVSKGRKIEYWNIIPSEIWTELGKSSPNLQVREYGWLVSARRRLPTTTPRCIVVTPPATFSHVLMSNSTFHGTFLFYFIWGNIMNIMVVTMLKILLQLLGYRISNFNWVGLGRVRCWMEAHLVWPQKKKEKKRNISDVNLSRCVILNGIEGVGS